MSWKKYQKVSCRGKKRNQFYSIEAKLPTGVTKYNSIYNARLLRDAKKIALKIYSSGLKDPKRMPISVEIIKVTVYDNKCALNDLGKSTYRLYLGMVILSERERIYVYDKQNPKGKRTKK